MTPVRFVLAIDQGTTSTRAILFDQRGRPVDSAQLELAQSYPGAGRVEHDPEEIWRSTVRVCRQVGRDSDIDCIGITNQRETSVVWDRATGRPIHPAIVWQDRRTAARCADLAAAGCEAQVRSKTGLLLDPYFSATKVAWILDHVAGARERAARGDLAFGTIDTFLLWRLTQGRVHATDATNASRTMLYDIERGAWDDELLELFDVPRALLPDVCDSSGDFGVTNCEIWDRAIPIRGVAGDQQAAAFGQACLEPGLIKSTYGTGCFVLLNTGTSVVTSQHRLLSTVGYQINGRLRYALEGSIFAAGSTVQWLRDQLGIVRTAAETEALARRADASRRVWLVPAFTGLGAPYWNAHARAALTGITRDTGPFEIARAALESVGYQTRDLLEAMRKDGANDARSLRVDGGMAANDFAMQFLADILDLPVERPVVLETTAKGAAYLAGIATGFFPSLAEIAGQWQCERVFEPAMAAAERDERYAGWRDAVGRVLA